MTITKRLSNERIAHLPTENYIMAVAFIITGTGLCLYKE